MDPTTIVLSPPRNAPATVLRQLAEPWSNLGILPRAVGKLGLDADGDMSFTGKTAECRDWEQLLKRADSDPMQAVHFHSVPAKDDLYLYQWAVQGGRRLSVELGRGKLRYFASDEFEPVGRYQVALMLALAAAADADVLRLREGLRARSVRYRGLSSLDRQAPRRKAADAVDAGGLPHLDEADRADRGRSRHQGQRCVAT
jgi:hypothetical protein